MSHLTWSRAVNPGQHTASHPETGLSFVITRIDTRQKGAARWDYEIEEYDTSEVDWMGQGRLRDDHGWLMFRNAKAECERRVERTLAVQRGEDPDA